MSRVPVLDAAGRVLARAELVHPGTGEAFAGGHRRVPGGVLCREGALLVLPGLQAMTATPEGLLLVRRAGPGWLELARWRGGRLEVLDRVQASGLRVGAAWRSAWSGGRAWASTLDGRPLDLPLGARRGQPWPDGPGLGGADGAALFRVDPGLGLRVVAVLDAPVQALFVGPRGAMVAATAQAVVGLAPGRGPRDLALSPPLRAVAFAPDGGGALIEDDEGTTRVDLGTGEVQGHRADARPSRWGRVVDVAGVERAWEDEDEDEALLPGPGVVWRGALHGPGGLAWDLASGQALGPAATSGAELAAVFGADLLRVDEEEVLRVDARGEEHPLHELDPEDPALELAVGGSPRAPLAVLRTRAAVAWGGRGAAWSRLPLLLPAAGPLLRPRADGRVLVPSAEGDRLLPDAAPDAPDLAPPPLPPALAGLGLPWEGWARAPDGRLWAWLDEGPLLRLPPEDAPTG